MGTLITLLCPILASSAPRSSTSGPARPVPAHPAAEARKESGSRAEPATTGILAHVEVVTLRNGLRLLLAPDPASPVVDVAGWYASGILYERPGIVGVSHLFEHMGLGAAASSRLAEQRASILDRGGRTGAYTAADYTCFYATVPPDVAESALRLEATRMSGSFLSQAALDRARREVRDENARRANAPAIARGLELLYATAFPDHPYRWPVVGLDSDLQRITLAQCNEYFRSHYGPARTLITIVGRFDRDEALRWARAALEPLPAGPPPSTSPARKPARSTSARRAQGGIL